ncbi:E3 ubiquitin-protein ligase MYLIP-like [Anneissia japonica]|uniref:E3 ubiquitin-protein ligase MYLIP-like n=1 Tax=Anneissia japonica TaxID=1529436 RepID=UPI001425AE37|nr:E3 ubiquitin-protein ligase MYLIP-like [Anneissia japonica]
MSFQKCNNFSYVAGKMLAHVKKPDNSVEQIEINSKQTGQDCLDEVCRRMDIVEVDYFGLKAIKKEKNVQWLNLKNPLLPQLQGQQPYWLELRVKYHVEPHLIQQQSTRHLFYLEAKKRLEDETLFAQAKKAAAITALIAQAEHGDYNPHQCQYHCFLPAEELTDEYKIMIVTEHARLRGMRRSSAEYKLVQEVYSLDDYGVEFWDTELFRGDSHITCKFGVGTVGIIVRWNDHETPVEKSILYSALDASGTDGKYCDISFRTDEHYDIESMRFKFPSREQAEGLYRAIIESLTFFTNDTVSEEVHAQFTRDFKGTLASLFKEKTRVGKRYMFDVRRTAKEVYDDSRRQLFAVRNKNPFANISEDGLVECLDKSLDECCKVKEEEALKCRICMAMCIDTVFPCGHVSCQDCARRLDECHMCRGSVNPALHIYLPTSA